MQSDDGYRDEFGPAEPPEGLALPPWEQRETYGFLNGLYLTVKGVLLSPRPFFHRMPTRLGLAQPLLFAVVVGVAASFVFWMWSLAGSSLQAVLGKHTADVLQAPFVSFGVFLFSPVIFAINVFVRAALFHLLLMLTGGNRLGFEASFRVAAYSLAGAIMILVPFCGTPIGVVWIIVVSVIGLYSIHETEPWKAIVAVLAPEMLCLAATGSALSLLLANLH